MALEKQLTGDRQAGEQMLLPFFEELREQEAREKAKMEKRQERNSLVAGGLGIAGLVAAVYLVYEIGCRIVQSPEFSGAMNKLYHAMTNYRGW